MQPEQEKQPEATGQFEQSPSFNNSNIDNPIEAGSCILPISRTGLDHLMETITKVGNHSKLINIKFMDISCWDPSDIEKYRMQLCSLGKTLREKLNIFAHYNKRENTCNAGVTEFALAPNGKLYYCPGFYYECPSEAICSIDKIETLSSINTSLHNHSKSSKCIECSNMNCEQCTLQNLKITGFSNLPAKQYCEIVNTATQLELLC